jgi:hypothetical protein
MTIISALSLAMIFTGINTGFAKNDPRAIATPTSRVLYTVHVNIEVIKSLCNNYNVEITDANGNLVAPVQQYIPGNSVYNFAETIRQASGIRVARLVVVTYGPMHFVCDQELFAAPDVKLVQFHDRLAVNFNLFPKPEKAKGIQ